MAFGRSGPKTGPATPLTFHFFAALLNKTFAFAILAFHFPLVPHLLSEIHDDTKNEDVTARSSWHDAEVERLVRAPGYPLSCFPFSF